MLFGDPERILAGHETPAHRSLKNERNLLGWSEAGEKTKFIVVALGFTQVKASTVMGCRDAVANPIAPVSLP
jgi:hypothetical protein